MAPWHICQHKADASPCLTELNSHAWPVVLVISCKMIHNLYKKKCHIFYLRHIGIGYRFGMLVLPEFWSTLTWTSSDRYLSWKRRLLKQKSHKFKLFSFLRFSFEKVLLQHIFLRRSWISKITMCRYRFRLLDCIHIVDNRQNGLLRHAGQETKSRSNTKFENCQKLNVCLEIIWIFSASLLYSTRL